MTQKLKKHAGLFASCYLSPAGKVLFLLVLINAHSMVVYGQLGLVQVLDSVTLQPVPFATVKFGNGSRGMIADLDGYFRIPDEFSSGASFTVSCLGYDTIRISLPTTVSRVFIHKSAHSLAEVTFAPPYDKIRRLIDNAVRNRDRNNPDKYDWYQCSIYYKMTADASRLDTFKPAHPDKDTRLKDMMERQYLLMSETFSRRTWHRTDQLQEDVRATRFSGFKNPMFSGLVTDYLPFHAYSDYLTLNGHDYRNPVSKGSLQYYSFNLADELITDKDTTWILSFLPKKKKDKELKGKVYINSDGYAISYFVAAAVDTMLGINTRLEQEYHRIMENGGYSKWFPQHLNYIIEWEQEANKKKILLTMKGNSSIDSVSFDEHFDFKFDKAHTTRLPVAASNDSLLAILRKDSLNVKEKRTYTYMDSLGEKEHFDKILEYTSKSPDWKVPVNFLDFDLTKLYRYNAWEGNRVGLGAQTNEKISGLVSVGGYFGYGFRDKAWKYGALAELYLDKYKEAKISLTCTDDVSDPGRIKLGADIDKNYLNYYLLSRVDHVKEYAATLKKKAGYWNFALSARAQNITPMYPYQYEYLGATFKSFDATEASALVRYAYAERTSPFFNTYYKSSSKYPVFFAKITYGELLPSNSVPLNYVQAVAAGLWHKHVNRLGFEHILVKGGITHSGELLPASKLFAANGYNYITTGADPSLYTFGGMMTLTPYQYYSEQFVNLIYRHDFDWKLYRLESAGSKFSSVPFICLQYNMLYGSISHTVSRQASLIPVPVDGINECGLLAKSLLRLRYEHLYYLSLDLGYFSRFSGYDRIVIGADVEIQ